MLKPQPRPSLRKDLRRLSKYAWWLGILAGIMCNTLPAEYRTVCHAVVNACMGGI